MLLFCSVLGARPVDVARRHLLLASSSTAYHAPSTHFSPAATLSRRQILSSSFAAAVALPNVASAALNDEISDEERARINRKLQLQQSEAVGPDVRPRLQVSTLPHALTEDMRPELVQGTNDAKSVVSS